jgi:hypothetical protein
VDCWDVLGVAPNADSKTIKLAYSELIKKVRPDDDPEGFQQLNSACKAALKMAVSTTASPKDNDKDSSSGPPLESHPAHAPAETGKSHRHQPPGTAADLLAETATDNPETEQQLSDLISRVEAMLDSPEQRTQSKSWEEVCRSPVLQDLQLRKKASDRIFCLIADSCLDAERSPEAVVDTEVLHYLNDEFQWEKNRSDLLLRFGKKRVDALLAALEVERVDWSFRLVAATASLIGIAAILCGYFAVPVLPVVLGLAVLSTARRYYIRQWQVQRQGFSNGGDADFLKGNKTAEVFLLYLSACIVEFLFYGVGWLLRVLFS